MNRPANLTRLAAKDLVALLDRSARMFGEAQANRLEARILRQCDAIAQGRDLGHTRPDLKSAGPTRFLLLSPILIAYNPETRLVIRILDGRRDLTGLFGDRPPRGEADESLD